jgi:hypothetical protein
MSESSKKTETKTSTSGKAAGGGIPVVAWVVALVVLVGIVAVVMGPAPAPVADSPSMDEAANQPSPPLPDLPVPNDVTLPDSIFVVSISPEAPEAGNDVTVTAALNPEYAYAGWENDFSFEIGIRQFGNWETQSCSSSPCSLATENVSSGELEYRVVRFASENGQTTQHVDGLYSVTVESSVQTGDTLGPKVVVFFSPAKPKAGQSVSITASVEDISGLEKVEIYVNGELKKTCPQKVKISQCQVSVPNLVGGLYTYYAIASDVYGNTTDSGEKKFTVDLV